MGIEERIEALEKSTAFLEKFIARILCDKLREEHKKIHDKFREDLKMATTKKLKFRFHRGSFSDSLKTTVFIESGIDLNKATADYAREAFFLPSSNSHVKIDLKSDYQMYDSRIGWDDESYLITMRHPDGNFYPIGQSNFDLSELDAEC